MGNPCADPGGRSMFGNPQARLTVMGAPGLSANRIPAVVCLAQRAEDLVL